VLLSAMASAGSIGISLATATGGDPRATLIAAAGAVAAALFSVSTHTRNEERIAVAQAVINASKKIIPDPLSEGFYPLLFACAANKEQASQIVQVYKNRLRKNATDF
ncbi:MAG: hypothetical protein KDD70_06800, partial [Bdellovibrionales bacterium]|nr:hypothetical protein [Bdellovibrionales bacterium]